MAIRSVLVAALAAATWSGAWAIRPLAAQTRAPIREVLDDDVDRAIDRTVRWIYGRQQPGGHWPNHYSTPRGGETALCLFALLDAGESPGKEGIVQGIDALCKLQTNFIYIRTLRVMVLAQAYGKMMPKEAKAVFDDDMKWLTTNAAAHGAWGYGGPDRTGDNSCSQFALLALWEATRAGVELNPAIFRAVERTWIGRQKRTGDDRGGWTYAAVGQGDATASMTAAGLASMYICQDALVAGACRPYGNRKVIDDAMAFLAAQLKPEFIDDGYLAFCVQRVGLASGLKFFGEMDWFATGARELVKPMPAGPSYRGQWGPDTRAAFELLFLSRGRVPLVFNKLSHGGNASGWDHHPRDIAQFALFMRRSFERRMRWQIVDIADDMRLLLDAPILLITAARALEFSDAEWDKLRQYALRGGMLLFLPVHVNMAYVNSVREKLTDLFAEQRQAAGKYYELVQVPADDGIYRAYKPINFGDKALPLWGVSDGTRWLAMLCPTDTACTWQRYQTLTQPLHFDFGINLYFYATAGNDVSSRMRPVFVGSDRPVLDTVKVGWLAHGGNWNTQPFALEYLSQKLAADENRLALDVTGGVVPGTDDLSQFKLLWLTGTDEFAFNDAQVAALRRYLDDNGTIFINAIGGAEPFIKSVDQLIARLGEGRAGLRTAPPVHSGLIDGKLGEHRGLPIGESRRVERWRQRSPRVGGPLETYVEGDWPRVIIAPNGVHDTLDGHTAWSALSYMPRAAGQIAANVVLYAVMDRPPPPVPEPPPSTQPAEDPAPAAPAGS